MADDQFQYIKLPDGSYGKFASDASDDVIKGAIQKDFPDAFTPTPVQQVSNRTGFLPNTSMSAGTQAFDQAHPNATPKPPGIMSRFASGAGIPTSQPETTQAVQGLFAPQADPNEPSSLVRGLEQVPVLGGDFRARADLSKRADQEGGTGVGVAHRIASYLPLVGPAVTAAQDKYDQGDYAGAFGAGISSLFAMEGLKGSVTPKPNAVPTDQTIQQVAARKPFTPPAPLPKALPAGPIFTPPPADTSGSVPYTPPPVAATTRAQRLGLMLPEKARGPIQLGPGEVLSPDSPEGLLPAAPRFLVDKTGNPRVQFLTSPATDQVASPSANADSAQTLFQGAPASKPNLLDGIRDHEFLSKTQNELEGQEGDDEAQAKIQGWMEAHNQQAPGSKPGPGLMNRAAMTDIEQANAQGKAVLPPELPQASPGLMARAKSGKGGPPSPAQATPAAQPMRPPVVAAQPQLATEANMEQLLADSLAQQNAKKGPGLMRNQAPAAPPVENRGQYPDLRAELDKMAPEDQQRAIFIHDKTDLPNRRAFDIAQQNSSSPAVAMSDSDGLKAFNDKFGYSAGNALLKAKADALREAGVEAYHFSGDEFGARGNSIPEDLKAKLDQANEILKNKVIHVETNDGQALKFTGAQFSSGAGENLGTAETQLKANKAAREAAGERKRGELGTIKQVK